MAPNHETSPTDRPTEGMLGGSTEALLQSSMMLLGQSAGTYHGLLFRRMLAEGGFQQDPKVMLSRARGGLQELRERQHIAEHEQVLLNEVLDVVTSDRTAKEMVWEVLGRHDRIISSEDATPIGVAIASVAAGSAQDHLWLPRAPRDGNGGRDGNGDGKRGSQVVVQDIIGAILWGGFGAFVGFLVGGWVGAIIGGVAGVIVGAVVISVLQYEAESGG